MTRAQIEAVTAERFAIWQKRLNDEGATPIVMLSLAGDRFVVNTVEEMTNAQLEVMLSAMLGLIRAGRIEERRKGSPG